MSLILDVGVGVLRGLKRDDLAAWITNAPGEIGKLAGEILAGGLESDGKLDTGALSKLDALHAAHPSQRPPQPTDLVEEYLYDLNALLTIAAPLATVALKGF